MLFSSVVDPIFGQTRIQGSAPGTRDDNLLNEQFRYFRFFKFFKITIRIQGSTAYRGRLTQKIRGKKSTLSKIFIQ